MPANTQRYPATDSRMIAGTRTSQPPVSSAATSFANTLESSGSRSPIIARIATHKNAWAAPVMTAAVSANGNPVARA